MNDTLPATLTQFGDELTRVIARELRSSSPVAPPPRRRPPRRRPLVAVAVVVCALATAVVVSLAGGSGLSRASYDEHVLRAADIALPRPVANVIVYVSVTQTITPGARGRSVLLAPTLNAEGWFQQGASQRSLTRERTPGQPPSWQTASRIYDPATRHAYVNPPLPSSQPHFTLTKNTLSGSYTLRVRTTRYGSIRKRITNAQANALRNGSDGVQWSAGLNALGKFFVNASVVSRASASDRLAGPPSSTSLEFPARLHQLLQSGHAQVERHVTVDGRAAIKIAIASVSGYQRLTYYVNAKTYRPVELDSYGLSSKDLTRIVFHSYQQLPLKGNARLLHLHTAQGTILDHNPADYFHHIPPLLFW